MQVYHCDRLCASWVNPSDMGHNCRAESCTETLKNLWSSSLTCSPAQLPAALLALGRFTTRTGAEPGTRPRPPKTAHTGEQLLSHAPSCQAAKPICHMYLCNTPHLHTHSTLSPQSKGAGGRSLTSWLVRGSLGEASGLCYDRGCTKWSCWSLLN